MSDYPDLHIALSFAELCVIINALAHYQHATQYDCEARKASDLKERLELRGRRAGVLRPIGGGDAA
jgi:hypothetical protein